MPRTRTRQRQAKRPSLVVPGQPAWLAWVDELAEHSRLPMTIVVNEALIEYAKSRKFDKPAPRRT